MREGVAPSTSVPSSDLDMSLTIVIWVKGINMSMSVCNGGWDTGVSVVGPDGLV